MKSVTTYQCDICKEEYDTTEEALDCEARGLEPRLAQVGDIVFVNSGFGWFDGEEAWVSNLHVRQNLNGTGLTAFGPNKPACPNRDSNCFSPCCTFQFYYVVTAIDTDHRGGHRNRYHVETAAMTGRQGYRGGYTYNEGHCTPVLVTSPPALVVAQSKDLIGNMARGLV